MLGVCWGVLPLPHTPSSLLLLPEATKTQVKIISSVAMEAMSCDVKVAVVTVEATTNAQKTSHDRQIERDRETHIPHG